MTSTLPTSLWVVPVADLGGVARHVLDVARVGMPGWRLVVLCPDGALADRLRLLGNEVVSGPFGPDAGFLASARLLRSALRSQRPAIVHSHLSYADVIAAWVVAFRPRTRLVTTEHGIAADDLVYHGSVLKSRMKALLHTVRLRRADAIIAVSNSTRIAMVDKWHPARTITVIPNGVDVEPTRRVPNVEAGAHGPRVLSLSRLSSEKRIPVLLAAFAELHRHRPTATLTIAGAGPERSELESLVRHLGLQEAVTFSGHIDATEAMLAADVVVQLSVWENCSYTLLDAVAAGLGVVATPVGGNVEILPSRCLVDAADPAAIAAAILDQAFGSERRPDLPSEWPDISAMAQRIVDCYEEVDRT